MTGRNRSIAVYLLISCAIAAAIVLWLVIQQSANRPALELAIDTGDPNVLMRTIEIPSDQHRRDKVVEEMVSDLFNVKPVDRTPCVFIRFDSPKTGQTTTRPFFIEHAGGNQYRLAVKFPSSEPTSIVEPTDQYDYLVWRAVGEIQSDASLILGLTATDAP